MRHQPNKKKEPSSSTASNKESHTRKTQKNEISLNYGKKEQKISYKESQKKIKYMLKYIYLNLMSSVSSHCRLSSSVYRGGTAQPALDPTQVAPHTSASRAI